MIKFKEKSFSEYDAMRSLYVELMRNGADDKKFNIIDTSSLSAVLRGNSVVIEKFVISSRFFGADKYRMYLKVGAKAKMPDEVRLPERYFDKKLLGRLDLRFNNNVKHPNFGGGGGFQQPHATVIDENSGPLLGNTNAPRAKKLRADNNNRHHSKKKGKKFSDIPRISLFSDNKKNKQHNDGGGFARASFSPNVDLSYEVRSLLGEAVKYDKKSRSVVLDFATIRDAIYALNILPFGLGYKIYLLDN